MALPQTYYDILSRKDNNIINYVNKDIEPLENDEPFGDLDDFKNSFDAYRESLLEKLVQFVLRQSSEVSYQEAREYIIRSEDYARTVFSAKAEYLAMVNYSLYGKKTFHIAPNLVQHLSNTNLDVDANMISLPFTSCLFVYNDITTVDALQPFIDDNNKTSSIIPINVFCSISNTDEGERKIVFACWQADHKGTTLFMTRELLLRKSWRLTDILKTDWTDIYGKEESQDSDFTEETDKMFYNEGLAFFRIILNTILYISSFDSDMKEMLSPYPSMKKGLAAIKKASKKKKARYNLNKVSKLNYISVGRNVQPISCLSKPNGNKMETRFMVRGHWRKQPCGPGLSERKLLYIQPYYKGPEMAEMVSKPYKVK